MCPARSVDNVLSEGEKSWSTASEKKTKQNVERGTGESRQYLVRLCDRDRVVRVIFLDLEVVAVFIPETSVRLPPL